MVEFLASRWGAFPWHLEEVPLFVLRRWFKVALENAKDEGALTLGSALLDLFSG